MSAPRMSREDLGGFYIHQDGSVWRLISYCSYPTATLQCVYADDDHVRGTRRDGAIGAPIFDGFKRLVGEN